MDTTKFKALIVITPIVLCLVGGFGSYYLYHKGYVAGKQETEIQHQKEKEAWETKVTQLQNEFDSKEKEITQQYQIKISRLNQQLSSFKTAPKTEIKYITQYVPEAKTSQLSWGFVAYHDRASLGLDLSTMITEDKKEECPYTLEDAMYAIGHNYTACNQCQIKLKALQQIVKDYQSQQVKLK